MGSKRGAARLHAFQSHRLIAFICAPRADLVLSRVIYQWFRPWLNSSVQICCKLWAWFQANCITKLSFLAMSSLKCQLGLLSVPFVEDTRVLIAVFLFSHLLAEDKSKSCCISVLCLHLSTVVCITLYEVLIVGLENSKSSQCHLYKLSLILVCPASSWTPRLLKVALIKLELHAGCMHCLEQYPGFMWNSKVL